MDKILIITYYWPPSGGSGVQRWLKFTKYLPDFDFQPYVYTPLNPSFNISDLTLLEDINENVKIYKSKIWEPYFFAAKLTGKKNLNEGLSIPEVKGSFIHKILQFIRVNFFIPDPRRFWVSKSVKELRRIIKKENIKVIVSTGPPHSMHLIGAGLKKWFPDMFWIVDIRDPWSKFDYLERMGKNLFANYLQRKYESRVLSKCNLVLATSYSMKKLLVPFDHNKFHTITNGYDEEDFIRLKITKPTTKLIIYHAGLLDERRNPTVLWKAINFLCKENKELDNQLLIHLVGTISNPIVEEMRSYKNLIDKLKIEEYKHHNEVLSDYTYSDVLLLLINNTPNSDANIPGKLFELLASKKPILCLSNSNSDAVKILNKFEGHLILNYNDNLEKIKSKLKSFLSSIDKKSIHNVGFEKYSRKELTQSLAKLIREKI